MATVGVKRSVGSRVSCILAFVGDDVENISSSGSEDEEKIDDDVGLHSSDVEFKGTLPLSCALFEIIMLYTLTSI